MSNPIEDAARQHCGKLLNSQTALMLPPNLAEALVILAFTYGAAWALDRHDMLELADAQVDSLRAAAAGAMA